MFLVDLILALTLIWLIGNVLRYFFFKDILGGGPFALSDKWIEEEKQKNKTKKGDVK